jgi:hypothetical protein
MIILPAKNTSSQFGWMLTICQLNSLTRDYTYVHRIMYLEIPAKIYNWYFQGGPKKYWWWERFPIHEIGRVDGGRGFRTGKNVFRIGGNTFYDRKNKIPMKIPEFKRSGIGFIAEFCGILNGFPNLVAGHFDGHCNSLVSYHMHHPMEEVQGFIRSH